MLLKYLDICNLNQEFINFRIGIGSFLEEDINYVKNKILK